jgi:hypothetical protein
MDITPIFIGLTVILLVAFIIQGIALTRAQLQIHKFIEVSSDIGVAIQNVVGIVNKNAEVLGEAVENTIKINARLERTEAILGIFSDYYPFLSSIKEIDNSIRKPIRKIIIASTEEED